MVSTSFGWPYLSKDFLGVQNNLKIRGSAGVKYNVSLINASWKFLRLRNSAGDFLGVNFWSRIFWGVLLEALGIFGGFDFCPHSIIPALFAILSTPPPPLGTVRY